MPLRNANSGILVCRDRRDRADVEYGRLVDVTSADEALRHAHHATNFQIPRGKKSNYCNKRWIPANFKVVSLIYQCSSGGWFVITVASSIVSSVAIASIIPAITITIASVATICSSIPVSSFTTIGSQIARFWCVEPSEMINKGKNCRYTI